MEKSLKKTVNETPLFASYPMAFIENNPIDNDSDAESTLYTVVRLLHNIEEDESKLSKFYEVIDKDDFFKVKLFLTERLYCLRQLEEQK
jgi:hypothetical protein